MSDRSSRASALIRRGVGDAILGTLTVYLTVYTLLLTPNNSAGSYRWLALHIGRLAAPIALLMSSLLLPLGFVLSLLKGQFLPAVLCIFAGVLGRLHEIETPQPCLAAWYRI